jgi:hypothetical protein
MGEHRVTPSVHARHHRPEYRGLHNRRLRDATTSVEADQLSSQYASGGTPGGSGVILTVTIRNGTKKTADLTLTTVKLAYGVNGDQADDAFDSENGLDGGFDGSVTPGHARTAKLGFAVPKGRQAMDVEVQPGFDYESVHFEGSVK